VYFDSRRGILAMRQMIRIGGRTVEAESEPLTDNSPRYRRMFSEAYAAWAYEQLEDERRRLKNGQRRRIPTVAYKQVAQRVKAILSGAISIDELSPRERKELEQSSKLETYLGANFIAKLQVQRDRYTGEEGGQQSWRPRHKRKLKFHRQRYRE
jgi:hypothetical protein